MLDKRLKDLRDYAQQAIDSGDTPAVQYAVAWDGELLAFESLGQARDTDRFCMFSATKPVFASLVWQLIADGTLDLYAPVCDYWPEFGKNGKQAVTVEHVLLHTSGFPNAEIDRAHLFSREGRIAQMQEWTLDWEPGTGFAYHGVSAHWVLAELVFRATGRDYREVLRARVLDPLGLDRLELGVPADRQDDLQRCVIFGEHPIDAFEALIGQSVDADVLEASSQTTMGYANDPELVALGVPGASGVSDAASVALFYQALLHNPGELWQPDLLCIATSEIRNTLSDRPGAPPANRTIGFQVSGDGGGLELHIPSREMTVTLHTFSSEVSPRTFGHPGFGGQIAWADPETGLSFAYLTNGVDRDSLAAVQRIMQLSSLAARCVPTP